MGLKSLIMTILFVSFGSIATAGEVIPVAPDPPDKTARYLFYLHGSGIDKEGVVRALENFKGNTQAFAERGFIVVAEVRPRWTINNFPEDFEAYARKIANQVNKLLAAQVPPRNITVAGYSRGGMIALMASGFVSNPEVGYALLAGCVSEKGIYRRAQQAFIAEYAPKIRGRFFSIFDAFEKDHDSCSAFLTAPAEKPAFSEKILQTGKGHQLFSEPLDIWIRPVTDWATAEKPVK